tara:strand:- start:143 stop:562 length:420 start_codon:yes stop_codon:yes gene_type:complete
MTTQTSIDTLEISVRSRKALHALYIETVEELAVTPDQILLRIPNCGRKTVNELRLSYDVDGLSIDQVHYAVGCVYSRFYSQIRHITNRENERVGDLEKRFARIVLRIEEREDRRVRRLQQKVDGLERDVAMGDKRWGDK